MQARRATFVYITAWVCAFIVGAVLGYLLGKLISDWIISTFGVSGYETFIIGYAIYFLTMPPPIYLGYILVEKTIGEWYRKQRVEQDVDDLCCLQCKYDLRRIENNKCPECGTPISWTRQQKIKRLNKQDA